MTAGVFTCSSSSVPAGSSEPHSLWFFLSLLAWCCVNRNDWKQKQKKPRNLIPSPKLEMYWSSSTGVIFFVFHYVAFLTQWTQLLTGNRVCTTVPHAPSAVRFKEDLISFSFFTSSGIPRYCLWHSNRRGAEGGGLSSVYTDVWLAVVMSGRGG